MFKNFPQIIFKIIVTLFGALVYTSMVSSSAILAYRLMAMMVVTALDTELFLVADLLTDELTNDIH